MGGIFRRAAMKPMTIASPRLAAMVVMSSASCGMRPMIRFKLPE